MPDWVVAATAVALLVATTALAILGEGRLLDWYLRRGRNRVWPTVGWVVGTHAAWWGAWLVVLVFARALTGGDATNVKVAVLVVPMVLLYGAFAYCFLPTDSVVATARGDFRRRGARRPVAFAFFLVGAPFAFLGVGICVAAFLATFVA